jgi:hypothetical protein
MKITRHDTVSGGSKAPHPNSGKLVFTSDSSKEHNTLAGFVEDGIERFVTDDIALARTFPSEGITVWVSANSGDAVRKTLDEIVAAFKKLMPVSVTGASI